MLVKYLILLFILISTEIAFGQNLKIVVEDKLFQHEKVNIYAYLILEDDTLMVNQGNNDFSHIDSEKYKSILIILNKDTLAFREVIDYGNELLNNAMKLNKPNFKLIQKNDWTLIIDKTPVKHQKLKKVLQNDIKTGTRIIAFESDKIEWVIMDKSYKAK